MPETVAQAFRAYAFRKTKTKLYGTVLAKLESAWRARTEPDRNTKGSYQHIVVTGEDDRAPMGWGEPVFVIIENCDRDGSYASYGRRFPSAATFFEWWQGAPQEWFWNSDGLTDAEVDAAKFVTLDTGHRLDPWK